MLKRLGSWNPTRGIWETEVHDLLSEHSEPFSETWPISGMTRGGVAYALPMPELRTDGSGSSFSHSLLKTPTSQLAVNGGSQHPDKRKEGGHGPTLADEIEHLLPTPLQGDGMRGPTHPEDGKRGARLSSMEQLLPTPSAALASGGQTSRSGARKGELLLSGIAEELTLLPTPAAGMPNDGESSESWLARRERTEQRLRNGNGMGMPLSIAAQLLSSGDHTGPRFSDGKQ